MKVDLRNVVILFGVIVSSWLIGLAVGLTVKEPPRLVKSTCVVETAGTGYHLTCEPPVKFIPRGKVAVGVVR